jgi:O-antigen ligase
MFWYVMICSFPLSVDVTFPAVGFTFIFPSEILVGLLAVIFLIRFCFIKKSFSFDKQFLQHPLTLVICVYFITLLSAGIFSSMPPVSWKAVLVRCCYILVFYFMMHDFIKSGVRSWHTIFIVYGCSMILVIIYTIARLSEMGMDRNHAPVAVAPFYNDHTMFGAAIAFLIPAITAIAFFPKLFQMNKWKRAGILVLLMLLISGLYISFCRAAWISIVVALIVLVMMLMRLRLGSYLILVSGIFLYVSLNHEKLMDKFRQNKADSNIKNAGFYEQTQSITNVTNDASNAERLNRWSCAIRMFIEKPFTGYGVGTYQFQYLAFQRKKEMTRISVTSPYNIPPGHGGSTHSEYLLALSEAGLFSFLAFIAMLLAALHTGLTMVLKSGDKKIRVTAGFVLLGLVTYFTHALFNNFLDNDKLAFLFWSSLSILATLDVDGGNEEKSF